MNGYQNHVQWKEVFDKAVQLFIFVLEILAVQIRNENQIRRLSFQRNDTNDDNIKIV